MGSHIQVGAFRLDAVLASGGMAEVWRGAHVPTGQAVAVKLMRSDAGSGALWQSAFRAEVRAMARLNHPAIVRIHDYGTVEHGAPALVPGTPWLAMELVEGGTLLDRRPRDWSGVQGVLAELLDALAEAHAHDVVHRDLKPANVLVGTDGAVKLTDFGIAQALDRLGSQQASIDGGTPPFMAPEQFEGRFRDTGPWTDLYAVGCLAWWLVCGVPPYGREQHWMRAALAHSDRPLPALKARFPVPDGLEGWLHRLLQKAPVDRFAAAADAAWALALLGPAPGSDVGNTVIPDEDPTAPPTDRPWRFPREPETDAPTQMGRAIPGRVLAGSGRPMAVQLPPVPTDWGGPEPGGGPLAGVGLGLFGLRELPVVGREAERDALWTALHEAVRDRAARLVVLTGPAGTGKSRLAEWFVQRTRAVGAARWSVAVHSSPSGPGDGVGPMVLRDLRLQDLPREAAIERIRRLLLERGVYDGDELAALAALALPTREGEAQGPRPVRFSAPVERFALVLRHLERKAAGRVAGLWIDDGQWGLDAVQLSGWLLERARFPLVGVITIRDEALEQRPAERAELDALLGSPGVRHLAVGPLDASDEEALLGRWLGLGPELAAEVRERTGGNPLFAVQLVGDQVERDLLEAREGGFELRAGALAELPDGLHEMWLARFDRVVAGRVGWREVVHLAAALGMDLDLGEWRALCGELGLPDPEPVIDALVRAKLARSLGPERVRFEHALLRESVERDAVERGAWVRLNRACASWLDGRGGTLRVGRHLYAAGDWDRAVDLLLAEANTRVFLTELRQAGVSIGMAERALEELEAPEADPRWGLVRLRRASVLDDRGEGEAAYALAEETLELSRRHGWDRHEAGALYRMGSILRDRPDVPRARARFEQCLACWEALGDDEGRATALHELGRVAMFAGEYERSEALHREAMALYDGLDRPGHTGSANCHRALGELGAWRRGDLDAAARHLRVAAERYRALGMRFGEASCLNGQAEIARHQGDLEAAEAGYRAAIRLTDAMGHEGGDVMRVNLGICRLEAGDPAGAREVLEPISRRLVRRERWGLVGFIDVLLLAAMAAEGRWDRWRLHADRALATLREASLVDADLAHYAEQAMRVAEAAGRSAEAADLRSIAAWQWRALGDEERAAALD